MRRGGAGSAALLVKAGIIELLGAHRFARMARRLGYAMNGGFLGVYGFQGGEPVYRTVSGVPGDVDMVNVFRRGHDVPPHVDDIIAKRPKSVWMQLGIRNDAAAERLARAGIDVVQDRCLLVELRRRGL